MWARLKTWARRLKDEVIALWLAARDPRTPLTAKLMAGVVAAYALSPIDLIPDFIPVLGYLDDLVLVPAGIWLAVQLIPEPLMDELRRKAVAVNRPRSLAAAALIVSVWVAVVVLAGWWLWTRR